LERIFRSRRISISMAYGDDHHPDMAHPLAHPLNQRIEKMFPLDGEECHLPGPVNNEEE